MDERKLKVFICLILFVVGSIGSIVGYVLIQQRIPEYAKEAEIKLEKRIQSQKLKNKTDLFQEGISYGGKKIHLPCELNQLQKYLEYESIDYATGKVIMTENENLTILFDQGVVYGICTSSEKVSLNGICVGMERERVENILGSPDHNADGSLTYENPKDKKSTLILEIYQGYVSGIQYYL